MKKLLIVCLFTLVFCIISSPAFSQDPDGDGVPDIQDNCLTTPNGPDLGTCYSWSGMTGSCTSDNDCGGSPGSCSMNQEDTYPPGGNDCGDACECEGDFDRDGDVDVEIGLLSNGQSSRTDCTNENPCNGDFDCDGDVGQDDQVKFDEDFGRNMYSNPCPNCVTDYTLVYVS